MREINMKLIIAGGRNYRFTSDDYKRLDSLMVTMQVKEAVSGGAPGADAYGEAWAKGVDIPVRRFPADWDKHGKSAGPIRNAQMAEYADAVVLFPGGRGTESMHREAIKAGIAVFDFSAGYIITEVCA